MIWDMEMLVHMVWALYIRQILIEFLKMAFVLLTDIQLQRHAHPVDMQFSLENTLGEIKEHEFCLVMHHYYLIYQRKHYPLY